MRAPPSSLCTVALCVLVAGCGSDDTAGNAAGGEDGGRGGGGGGGGAPPIGSPENPPAGLWVRGFEGAGDEHVAAIRAQPGASFLVLGAYEAPATFNPKQSDETVLAEPSGASETVLLHYGPDGSLRSVEADPLGTGSGGVHVAADGGLYAVGSGVFTAGTVMVPSDADVFVARYAPDGTPMWAASATGASGTGSVTSVDTWSDGGVVIGGPIQGTLTFGVGEANETRLAATGAEIFLARYDADGALRWARRAIVGPYLPDWKLAATADGGVALYGRLENTTTFNPGLGDETRLDGGNIGFVVQLDEGGTVKWANAFAQDPGTNGVSDVASFDDGSVVVTGSFDRILTLGTGEARETTLAAVGSDYPGRTQFPDFYAARFDAAGKLVWARREGGAVWDAGAQVEALEGGGVLIAGTYTNDVTFAPGEAAATTLSTEPNESTAFVAAIDSNGSMRWVRKSVSGQVTALSDGSIAIAGTFQGTTTIFPGEVGETTLASAGGWDAYVVRLGWEDSLP